MTKSTKQQAGKQSVSSQADVFTFDTAFQKIDQDTANAFALTIAAEFDNRQQFEISRNANMTADAPKIKKLNNYRTRLVMPSSAKVFIALGKTAAFFNRSISTKADADRFNIYSIDKVRDIVSFIAGDKLKAINLAILKSMINFEEAQKPFTDEMALMAVSDKIRSQNADAKLLVRHNVDKNTAGTQKSSTMNALIELGLVIATGTKKAATYAFADTDQARAFKLMVKAA